MKRAVTTLALLGVLGGGINVMAELTQNRPDPVVEGSVTTVDFTVSTNRYGPGDAAAAAALWTVCSATVHATPSAPVAHGNVWRATLTPAIGEHGENRLVGCLEDLTLDRVVGDVVALRSDA